MPASVVQVMFRHLTGSRATQVDAFPVGAHRELILGRAPSAAVRFPPAGDGAVGRQHARIEPLDDAGRFRLVDLGSRNGTWLNGRRLAGPAELRSGDIVQLGLGGPRLEFLVACAATPSRG